MDFYLAHGEEVLKELKTTPEGLTAQEAKEYGLIDAVIEDHKE